MNIPIFITMLFSLQLFYWMVGKAASRNLKDTDDYFLAGKSVKFFPLMMTFLATQVGGGIVLGSAEEAYLYGWPVLLYPLGVALGLILLGCGVGRKLAEYNVSTVAEIFEVVYGSPSLRKVAALLSIISLFMVLVAQIIASQKFLGTLGFTSPLLFILFWGIVIVYTAQGGLKAVISTDMIQAGFFGGVFLLALGFVLFREPVSFAEMQPFETISPKLCGWLLMPMLFMLIEQDMGQRCFAGASPGIVSRASFVAGICTMVICLVPVFFGTWARGSGLEVPAGNSVLMTAIAALTNPWISSLVGCAVLAAIISTATSLINAISSNLATDFNMPIFRRMSVVKMMTCLISVLSIFFAFYFDNVVDVLIQSYELSVSCLFVPVLYALFRRRGSFAAALMAMGFGAMGFVMFRVMPIEFFPREIASIMLSFIGFGVGLVFRGREFVGVRG